MTTFYPTTFVAATSSGFPDSWIIQIPDSGNVPVIHNPVDSPFPEEAVLKLEREMKRNLARSFPGYPKEWMEEGK